MRCLTASVGSVFYEAEYVYFLDALIARRGSFQATSEFCTCHRERVMRYLQLVQLYTYLATNFTMMLM